MSSIWTLCWSSLRFVILLIHLSFLIIFSVSTPLSPSTNTARTGFSTKLLIHCGDFKFASCTWLDGLGHFGYPITKHGGFLLLVSSANSFAKHLDEAIAVEDIVAQHQAGTIITNELLPYYKCLLTPLVMGYSLVPDPPARTMPFIEYGFMLEVRWKMEDVKGSVANLYRISEIFMQEQKWSCL